MKNWKSAEKEVAEKLGGMRRVRASYSDSIEDVFHPTLAIEVKYGGQVPKYCQVKHPTSNGEYDLIPSDMWSWNIPIKKFKVAFIKRDKFIIDGLAQAYSYNPKKTPVLCVKPRGMRGFVIIMRHSDYMRGESMSWVMRQRVIPADASPSTQDSSESLNPSSLGSNGSTEAKGTPTT